MDIKSKEEARSVYPLFGGDPFCCWVVWRTPHRQGAKDAPLKVVSVDIVQLG